MTTARPAQRRTAAVLGLALLGTALAGCAGGGEAEPAPPAPRAVTSEEAERLAVLRFRNFDAGTRSLRAVYSDSGHEVALDGHYDYAAHAGFATVSVDGAVADAISWDGAVVAISPDPPAAPEAGEPPASVEGWTLGPLDPSGSRLETVLALIASLGADRPENPLLLAQGGALWLREDEIDGARVTVFAGPASDGAEQPPTTTPDPEAAGLRYWVDETGLALRVEIRLAESWATVDLGEGGGVTVAPLPAPPGAAPNGSGDG